MVIIKPDNQGGEVEDLAHPPRNVAHHDMEEALHRPEVVRERYEKTGVQYRKLLEEKPEGQIPGLDDPLTLARCAKPKALADTRLLEIFTKPPIHRAIPGKAFLSRDRWSTRLTGSLISTVDDDESARDSTRALLRSAGYDVATFASGEAFLESGALSETRCLVLDIRMPGMSGLELQRRVNRLDSGVPIIFVTAHDDKTNHKLAIDAGASEVFKKPFSADLFLRAIHMALENSAYRHTARPSALAFVKDEGAGLMRNGKNVIYVVDDEKVIADTLAMILRQSGFSALAFEDPCKAFDAATEGPPPDLLISDVVMPRMSGIELAIQIQQGYPQCKVLLFSGQAITADLLETARLQGHQFEVLQKPVHPSDLLAKVRGVSLLNVPVQGQELSSRGAAL